MAVQLVPRNALRGGLYSGERRTVRPHPEELAGDSQTLDFRAALISGEGVIEMIKIDWHNLYIRKKERIIESI
jgi:hypothetical protein